MHKFEVLPHTGDSRLRAFGSDLGELLTAALQGMFVIAEPRLSVASQPVEQSFSLVSADRESLLVDFLSNALALSDIHQEAYDRVEFSALSETGAAGKLFGKKTAGFETQIKAVTYHDLLIGRSDSGLACIITFDL